MLILNTASNSSVQPESSQLMHDPRYQEDVRAAIDAGLHVVFVHDVRLSFGRLQGALWDRVGSGTKPARADPGVFCVPP